MNISPVRISTQNALPSFGMAQFSPKGLELAQSCGDIYAPLATPEEFQAPDFFKKKKMFKKAPFVKYIENTLPAKKSPEADKTEEVTHMIVECGTSKNAVSNAMFVRQLLGAKPHIEKLAPEVQEPVRGAVEKVFEKNWNNPELSKGETLELLELSKGAIDDKTYVTLTGVIEKSDTKSPKGKKDSK